MIDRKRALKLRKQGLSTTEIAKIMGYSQAGISKALRNDYKPKTKRTCPICGDTFMIAGKQKNKTCRNDTCIRKYIAIQQAERYTKLKKEKRLVREYSDITNRFIVEDLLLGISIKEIAETYNRGLNDLKKHIENVLTPEVRQQYIRQFSNYQKTKIRRFWDVKDAND